MMTVFDYWKCHHEYKYHVTEDGQNQSKIIVNMLHYVNVVVMYEVRKMAKSLLKHHCYCPMSMLLMQTTKTLKFTAVSLQRPFSITFMGFNWCSS